MFQTFSYISSIKLTETTFKLIDKHVLLSPKNSNQQTNKDTGEQGKWMVKDNLSSSSTNGKSSVVEEEEVILFRPLQ